ncbi:MAG: RNA polymerase sigma factor [Trebonia sp.]
MIPLGDLPVPEPPTAVNDAAVIARSTRDPEAFAALYDRHAATLHRYVTRRLGGGAADDIVADTFLDAFKNRHRFDPVAGDARPWLYGIAANHIGKRVRAEVRMLRAYARTGTDPVLTASTGSTGSVAEAARHSAGSRRKPCTGTWRRH